MARIALRQALMVIAIFSPLWIALASEARAEYPRYVVLRTPTAPTPGEPTFGYYPGEQVAAPTQGFAYGWFGAAPRTQPGRSFGYYRSYTQWRQW